MERFKRTGIFILAFLLLVSLCPAMLINAVNTQPYSESLVEFIKYVEGFSATPYWDYLQYTHGYGTRADGADDVISKSEADKELRDDLNDRYACVADYIQENNLTLNQSQIDALISITFNLGTGWMSPDDCMFSNYILKNKGNLSTMDPEVFASYLVRWSHAGGDTPPGLVLRRLEEAQMFCYGEYVTDPSDLKFAALKVNSKYNLPSDIFAYYYNQTFESLPLPSTSSKYFAGWILTSGKKERVGSKITVADTPQTLAENSDRRVFYVTASWSNSAISGDPNAAPQTPSEPEPDPEPDPNPADNETAYSDVKSSDWYYSYIQFVTQKGFMTGTAQGVFSPNVKMTRAMLVKALYNVAGNGTKATKQIFNDVKPGDWYYDAVDWAYNAGIVMGVGGNCFSPNTQLTREAASTIIFRFVQTYPELFGTKIDLTSNSSDISLSKFGDSQNVSSWAVTAMTWAVGNGIINGYEDGNIYPSKAATRAEIAAIFYRVYN